MSIMVSTLCQRKTRSNDCQEHVPIARRHQLIKGKFNRFTMSVICRATWRDVTRLSSSIYPLEFATVDNDAFILQQSLYWNLVDLPSGPLARSANLIGMVDGRWWLTCLWDMTRCGVFEIVSMWSKSIPTEWRRREHFSRWRSSNERRCQGGLSTTISYLDERACEDVLVFWLANTTKRSVICNGGTGPQVCNDIW